MLKSPVYRTIMGCLLAAIVFSSSIAALNAAQAEELFTINTADKPPFSTINNDGIYDKIILRLFEDMGAQIRINHLLSARSIENVQVGLDDAEYARIKGLSEKYNNIAIVDEKLLDFSFTAFSKNGSIKINGWESLLPYNVAFMRGWKIYEKNVKAKSILIVSTEQELFQVLQKDRVDIILYEFLRGMDYMKKNGISEIIDLKPSISKRGMYLYLNKKHIKLVPKIEDRLRKFKKSKDYHAIIETRVDVK